MSRVRQQRRPIWQRRRRSTTSTRSTNIIPTRNSTPSIRNVKQILFLIVHSTIHARSSRELQRRLTLITLRNIISEIERRLTVDLKRRGLIDGLENVETAGWQIGARDVGTRFADEAQSDVGVGLEHGEADVFGALDSANCCHWTMFWSTAETDRCDVALVDEEVGEDGAGRGADAVGELGNC